MTRPRLTHEERRERARLRALRWRRAHGIGPRKPAQRPWLALGISRSIYYRWRAEEREQEQVRTDITKEEAARRQLETAIALFFCENDEISVHVLASSAAQILTDVCRAKNIVSFRDIFIARIKPEYRNWAVPKLNMAYNYFKHADRDASDLLSRFHPGMNATLLFGCCHDYWNLFGEPPPVLLVFHTWWVGVNPDMIRERFPSLKNAFLQAFDGLDRKPEAEQRREGRELLRAYSLDRKQELPLRAWCGTFAKSH